MLLSCCQPWRAKLKKSVKYMEKDIGPKHETRSEIFSRTRLPIDTLDLNSFVEEREKMVRHFSNVPNLVID